MGNDISTMYTKDQNKKRLVVDTWEAGNISKKIL